MPEQQQPGPISSPQSVVGSLHLKAVPAKQAPADLPPTIALVNAYSDEDGFHCPRCDQVIKDPNSAVDHIEHELKGSLQQLEKAFEQNKLKKPRIPTK